MELLSPAGNRDSLFAAISCGADAVYLGYTAFGARSYAGNFNNEGLRKAVEYAHERGRKIYVTVNTLIKQCETDDLCDVLELLSRCGVDAIIVQDMGVARIARERFPQLTLHASTQMTIHNAQGARLMQRMGFTRVVPARECPLSELKLMADTGVEIEAFVHGALCVAVSGQCLFSSMIGGRSGNRGRCAQPCRLPYALDDGTSGYLLSPKDLMLIDRIPQIRDAGVYSLKLEGRMKRPEYVGVVTRAYREAMDAAQAHVSYHPDEKTLEDLRQIFNRGGFTEGYVMDCSNAALMSWERPNHWGIRVGQILSARGPLAQLRLERDLNDGDGLQVRGKEDFEFTYSGNDTTKGNAATVRIASGHARPGDCVYRLTDAKQMKEIRELINKEQACIPLYAQLYAMPGKPPILSLSDQDGHSVRVFGEQAVDIAQQRALDHDSAFKQLSKMGGTPYLLHELTLTSEGAFMTNGMLNALRRSALEAMKQARTQIVKHPMQSVHIPCTMPTDQAQLIAQSERLCEAPHLLEAGADVYYWYPQDYRPQSIEQELSRYPKIQPVLVLPAMLRTQELQSIYELVVRFADRFSGVMLNNPGQFDYSWPVPVLGGQGLNIANMQSAQFFFALGAQRLTATCELSFKELRELFALGGSYEIEAYGRTLLMLLSHCPRRTKQGEQTQDARCNACAADGGCPAIYTDRKGYQFPARRLKMEHGCLVRLYNSVTTDLSKAGGKMTALDCSLRVSFTHETLERQCEIVASFRNILNHGCALHTPEGEATTGHLLRGVE